MSRPGMATANWDRCGASCLSSPKHELACLIVHAMTHSHYCFSMQGVPMTHHGVATAVAALGDWLDRSHVGVDKNDVYLSFLPLAHIYGRCGTH
mgnify:CR=1 FL=1